jgi:hypothetical protein
MGDAPLLVLQYIFHALSPMSCKACLTYSMYGLLDLKSSKLYIKISWGGVGEVESKLHMGAAEMYKFCNYGKFE